MKYKLIVCFLIWALHLNVNAQTNIAVSDTVIPSTVIIHQDERIETLLDKKIYIPEVTLESKVKDLAKSDKRVKIDKHGRVNVPGFRLQLMNSTDRVSVYNMKGKLYQLYPNVRQYVVAQAPFYKLRFGNFKTKEEAEKYKKALSSMFPGGIYVVNDIIEAQIDANATKLSTDNKTTVGATKKTTTNKTTPKTTTPKTTTTKKTSTTQKTTPKKATT
jgi:hypothetical protein